MHESLSSLLICTVVLRLQCIIIPCLGVFFVQIRMGVCKERLDGCLTVLLFFLFFLLLVPIIIVIVYCGSSFLLQVSFKPFFIFHLNSLLNLLKLTLNKLKKNSFFFFCLNLFTPENNEVARHSNNLPHHTDTR